MTALVICLIFINALLLGVIFGFVFGTCKKEDTDAVKSEPPVIYGDELEKVNSLYRNFLNYDGTQQP